MKNIESVYPLSHAQQGMLFQSITAAGDDPYLRQVVFELTGEVILDSLRTAWQNTVARQPVLRTSFLWDGLAQPVQMVHKEAVLGWEMRDWTNTGAEDIQPRLKAFLLEDRQRGMDLNRAPLLRCTVIRVEPASTLFVLTFHHIILDGWSVPLILEEIENRYAGLKSGQDVSFGPAPAYRNYISWLKRQDLSSSERFWTKYLKGVAGPASLVLGTLKDHASGVEFGEARQAIGARFTAQINEAARRNRVTINTLFQGAWATLLSRYTGQTDVIFGSVVSGRPHDLKNVEETLGVFITILPVRVKTENSPTVSQFLQQIQSDQAEARQYEYAPLGDIGRWGGIEGGKQLFESIIVFENYRGADRVSAGAGALQFRATHSFERTHFPLTLMVSPSDATEFLLVYNTGKFDRKSAETILLHLTVLLEGLAAEGQSMVADLPMLTPAEKQDLLTEATPTPVAWPEGTTFLSCFGQQAQHHPVRIAAHYNTERLTYRELDEKSNRLARLLRERGVGPGTLVAVCLDRSLDLLVSLLAVLKAGAAYVPLDPEYPADRIQYMLADSGATIVITDLKLAEIVRKASGVVYVDADSQSIGHQSAASLEVTLDPESLAYVIYTSGSTGLPKGVLIRHAGLINMLLSMRQEPGLASDDVLLAITTPCFDIAALELFLPLITGATVVIAPRDVVRNPKQLIAEIERSRASVVQATPAAWRMLIQTGWTGKPGLKVLCGGEALSRELADALLDRVGSVWNVYGPTETTIWSTVAPVHRDTAITIGRAIANTSIYILDRNMRLVPRGVTGDLYIGGAGIARGYHNRPELTAERFVQNPFGDPGSRLYCTGDLARYLADGSIECLGRRDHQVKIRGFRIELGEIETVLAKHPSIQEATVILFDAGIGDARLAAYTVARDGPPPATSELRAHLKKSLPDYMVPAFFTFLPSMPLTPNGKIDRKALPDPSTASRSVDSERPKDHIEAQIIGVFERVLGSPGVHGTDNFFDAGGHSLLAIRLMSEIEKAFGVNVPPATLFQLPTPRELATVVRDRSESVGWTSLVPLKPEGDAPPFFCVHSLGANVLSYRKLAELMPADQPFYGLQPRGLDGTDDIHASVQEMASHYLKEIREVQPRGPYRLGGVCLGGIVAFEMAQQLRSEGEATEQLIMIDSYYRPQPRYMPGVPMRATPGLVADYYLGELLMRGGRDRWVYALTRMRNIAFRMIRPVSRLFVKPKRGTLDRAIDAIHEVHSAAESSYVPKSYSGHITLFWCAEYPLRGFQDRRLGWSDVAEGGLEVQVVPGNHFSMLEPGHVTSLAEELARCLARTRKQQPKEAAHV
jgi:surfactin family lipopeptide synthetase C